MVAKIPLPIATRMIEQFQCPGCVNGRNTHCGVCEVFQEGEMFSCVAHVAGSFVTTTNGPVTFFLGLPRGFCRVGPGIVQNPRKALRVRLWPKDARPDWDKFNVPVWALERDGYLFVRTFMPRQDYPLVDVIEAGTLALVPGAINVGEFHEEI